METSTFEITCSTENSSGMDCFDELNLVHEGDDCVCLGRGGAALIDWPH